MPYKSEAQRKYFNVNRKKLEAQGVDVDEWNSASKGKKMPERVKESAVAKLAALSANEINDMDTTSGLVADIAPMSAAHRRRAGRARIMAQAADVPVPYRINRPGLSALTDVGLGALGGGLAETFLSGRDEGLGPAGALAGGVSGLLYNKLRARNQMRHINEDYDDSREFNKLKKIEEPSMSLLKRLILSSDVAGRKGERQAYNAITKNEAVPTISKLRAGIEGLSSIDPVMNRNMGLYDQISEEIDIGERNRQKEREERRKQLAKSGSSLISQLAKQAAYKAAFTPVDLMGAGIGGLAGGAAGYMSDPGYDEEGNRRSRFRNALIGGLGGAGMGGAYQYGLNRLRKHLAADPFNPTYNGTAPEASSAIGALAGGIGDVANQAGQYAKAQADKRVTDSIINRYHINPNAGDYNASKIIPSIA